MSEPNPTSPESQGPPTEDPPRLAAAFDPEGGPKRLRAILEADPSIAEDPDLLTIAAALAGASRALAKTLIRHPHLLRGPSETDSLSLRFRAVLVDIAGRDLAGLVDLATATSLLSDAVDVLVAHTLDAAVEAVSERHPLAPRVPLAIIAMGKWGARELNYYSDIDLLFVHQPVPGGEAESREAALAIASKLLSLLTSPTFDGPGLRVDAGLRPEGSAGPLSRSLDGYASYYERWGEGWELQALLKSRPAAGDAALGRSFSELTEGIVWERGLDSEALRNVRLIKAQAEEVAPPSDIKRSRGGIRDIEFSVQLLQLVHGRFDPDLRVAATLDAIDALERHGYIDGEEADKLAEAYRFLRHIEHRLQLWDLRQTHRLPSSPQARERLARTLGFVANPLEEFEVHLAEVRSQARDLHERLYFRPILDSLAGVPTARLDAEAATLRLEALGFADVAGATKAVEELTAGLSRKSRVMHQMLPLMLDWLSVSPDPDLGLHQLRLLLAGTPDHAALVTLLQTNPLAAERLCRLLGTGRLLGDLMDRIPEFIPRLADDTLLKEIRDLDAETQRLIGLLDSRDDPDAKLGTLRRFVRRRRLRIAARDVLGEAETEATLRALADTADAAVTGALHALTGNGSENFGVVAVGKWGGREMSYGSDIDLFYVYDDDQHRERALTLATGLARMLSEPSHHGEGLQLDTDLRPEGKSGPLARSLDSYRRYYREWAEPWELLALVKARPAAGDPHLLKAFTEMTGSLLWQPKLPESMVWEIRRIKARVESERIGPGEDPDYHLKLGPGGLTDVEFVTQLLQLTHGGRDPSLRATPTLEALDRLLEAGILEERDHRALREAYEFCTRVRLRLHLQFGRAVDSLPTDPRSAARIAASLGFDRTGELREQYRKLTRRARRSFEALFYESPPN
ncbi:MAG: bifunctional [glutamine synthetase] adenylyltransferase/[glutamine synthetase]-adenylyl-L-tyrosine phosphorylase [Acidimicrobiia bacterium]